MIERVATDPDVVGDGVPPPEVREVADGDPSVHDLHLAYDAHALALFRLAVALTGDPSRAEDLVHDAFLRLHHAPRRPAPGAERAFLRRCVINLVYDDGRRRGVVARLRPDPDPPAPSAEAVALETDRGRRVAAAVAALPPRQRDCVALHYFAGLPVVAVATELGVSIGSVKTHLHRARTALAPALEDLR